MNETEPRKSLEEQIKDMFAGVSTQRIIQKMQRGADFSTDDEEVELNRRLQRVGKSYRWTQDFTNPRVEIYELEDPTDEQLVNRALEHSLQVGRPIDHAAARVIAALYHSGQASDLYALASSGAITDGLEAEIEHEIQEAAASGDADHRDWMQALDVYRASRDDLGAVPGWSSLWLRKAEGDRCAACGAHIAEPHSPGCPIDGEVE